MKFSSLSICRIWCNTFLLFNSLSPFRGNVTMVVCCWNVLKAHVIKVWWPAGGTIRRWWNLERWGLESSFRSLEVCLPRHSKTPSLSCFLIMRWEILLYHPLITIIYCLTTGSNVTGEIEDGLEHMKLWPELISFCELIISGFCCSEGKLINACTFIGQKHAWVSTFYKATYYSYILLVILR
jgi:hypothetical protein